MNNYIFIGGAPLTGKSTLAKKFKEYTHVSTDDIRVWMQKILKPQENRDFFYDYGLDAIAFYEKYKTAQNIFELEKKQMKTTQKGIAALIESEFIWENVVIEGIDMTPSFVRHLEKNFSLSFNAYFLYDDDDKRIKERIYSRGLYDDADKYPDDLKEIECEWVKMYNDLYKTEAKDFGFNICHIDEIDKVFVS